MLATMVFGFPYQAVRTLAVTLALVALLAGAVVATASVVTMVTPVIVAAAPVAGCAALIVAFAWWFKP